MLRTSLLFFTLFVSSFNAARLPTPLNLGNGRLRSSMMERQNAEFGEGVRDWFKNMRDRIFGKDTSNQMKSTSPFDLNSSPMTNFLKNKKESEGMMIQPIKFFLNLSTLKFDPSKDWGFQIGNWYIIRKSDSSDEWDDNWTDFFESTGEVDKVSSTRDNGDNEEILRPSKTETTAVSSKKPTDENETTDNTSVEVLKPSI